MRRPSNEQSPHEVGAPSAGLDQSLNLEGEDNRQVESLVALWADRIRPHLAQAVEGIVAAGRELTEAKAALPHGQFGPLLRALGLSRHMANRFMRVAANRVLANGAPVHALPAAVSVLDTLTQLPDDELEAAIEAGEITPSTTRQQAANLVGRKAYEASIAARAELAELYHDLARPCCCCGSSTRAEHDAAVAFRLTCRRCGGFAATHYDDVHLCGMCERQIIAEWATSRRSDEVAA
jgi:hypothetical protein